MMSLSNMVKIELLLKWSVALIAGGGIAGWIKGIGARTRLISSAATVGLTNPVVSMAEAGAAVVVSLLAWFIPLIAFVLILILVIFLYRRIKPKRRLSKEVPSS
jgi:hypothetical protein